MKRTSKPPIGARPYYIAAENRIMELADAIRRNPGGENVPEWAREIMLQYELMRRMEDGKIF